MLLVSEQIHGLREKRDNIAIRIYIFLRAAIVYRGQTVVLRGRSLKPAYQLDSILSNT